MSPAYAGKPSVAGGATAINDFSGDMATVRTARRKIHCLGESLVALSETSVHIRGFGPSDIEGCEDAAETVANASPKIYRGCLGQ